MEITFGQLTTLGPYGGFLVIVGRAYPCPVVSILTFLKRCECPICPNQKSCVTFNFQVYCSRLYLHNVHTLLTVFTQGSLKAHLDVTLGPLSTHLANFIHRWVKMDQFSILSAKTFTIYRLLLILVGLLHLPPICLEFCKHFVTCMQA